MRKMLLFLVVFFLMVSVVYAQDIRYTVGGMPASVEKVYLSRAMDLVDARDNAALDMMLDAGLVFLMADGVRVEVLKADLLNGFLLIRPVGYPEAVWTISSGVRRGP